MERWPNLYIVGAPKAGTTSLHEYLNNIPGIFMSSIKEPYFFCWNVIPADHYTPPIRDKKKYLNLFKKVKDEKIIGESSVWYLSDPDSAELIHQVASHAKIIICIRDPVERALSHYLMHATRKRFKTNSFHEQLQQEVNSEVDSKSPHIRFNAGLYSEDIKRYWKFFGKDQVKIIIFEEFILEPKKTVEEVLRFLGFEHKIHSFKPEVHNPYAVALHPIINDFLNIPIIDKIRIHFIPETLQRSIKKKIFIKKTSKPKMSDEDRILLKNFYEDDVKKLQEMLGRKFPWPNFKNEKYIE